MLSPPKDSLFTGLTSQNSVTVFCLQGHEEPSTSACRTLGYTPIHIEVSYKEINIISDAV